MRNSKGEFLSCSLVSNTQDIMGPSEHKEGAYAFVCVHSIQ